MPRKARPEKSKYHPITTFLQGQEGDVVEVDFAFIERLIGCRLPNSATRYHQWWANTMSKHSQARSWMLAGWRAAVSLKEGTVFFTRDRARQGVESRQWHGSSDLGERDAWAPGKR